MTVLPLGVGPSRPGSSVEQRWEGFSRGLAWLLAPVGEVLERVVTVLVLGLMVVAGGVIAVVVFGVMAGLIQ